MKQFLRLTLEMFCALAFLSAGCASKPAETASPPPVSQTIPVAATATGEQTAAPGESNDVLPHAVTNEPAAFAGEGWESMFDGKTLTGWQQTTYSGLGEILCRSGVIVCNMGD